MPDVMGRFMVLERPGLVPHGIPTSDWEATRFNIYSNLSTKI